VIYASRGGGHPFAAPKFYAVGSQDATVRLLDLSTGSVVVVTNVGGPVVGLTGSIGWLTVTSSNGQLWGLKRHAEPIWKISSAAPYATAATVLNGIVYTSGEDQTVTAWSVPGRSIP
jgi:WD40 repeat protein